jgi:hypothetical protein
MIRLGVASQRGNHFLGFRIQEIGDIDHNSLLLGLFVKTPPNIENLFDVAENEHVGILLILLEFSIADISSHYLVGHSVFN